jgi:hypothetical protein
MIRALMSEHITDRTHPFGTKDGRTFRVSIQGEQRKDGTWSGWLEFTDLATGKIFRTGQETSQPNRTTVEYWATGIEDVYLEGALQRAREVED